MWKDSLCNPISSWSKVLPEYINSIREQLINFSELPFREYKLNFISLTILKFDVIAFLYGRDLNFPYYYIF